jgi:hypothetical protein
MRGGHLPAALLVALTFNGFPGRGATGLEPATPGGTGRERWERPKRFANGRVGAILCLMRVCGAFWHERWIGRHARN